MAGIEGFDAQPVLDGLKPFQRRTVDYAFQRLFDPAGSGRFLVADEVGLGKTLVARGVIARSLEALSGQGERVDIIYVCSNAAIAQQNIRRMNVLEDNEFALASRLTLLPETVHQLNRNPVNFISLTPGTTFNLRSSTGIARERVLLFHLLDGLEGLSSAGLSKVLQCNVGERWPQLLKEGPEEIEADLAAAFLEDMRQQTELLGELRRLCEVFEVPESERPAETNAERNALVGRLRRRLARVCLDALRPSLVILDEFQRFSDLLNGETEEAELANDLFSLEGARLLLLSATPYRMLSMHGESDEDHHQNFLDTVGFLYGDEHEVDGLRWALETYRRGCRQLAEGDHEGIQQAREGLQSRLLRVMCRTERVGLTRRRDAMLSGDERTVELAPLDLEYARNIDSTAHAAGLPDVIEYWKSVPYMLSYMRGYQMRRELDAIATKPPKKLRRAIARGKGLSTIDVNRIEAYEPLDIPHARMRGFIDETVGAGLWELLWLPPSLPYTQLAGPWARAGEVTKQLVFSAWNAVPDAIATLCSYEAQARAFGQVGGDVGYSNTYERVRPLLRFQTDADGRLTGMPALARIMPAPRLAREVDPLHLAIAFGNGEPPALGVLLVEATRRCRDLLDELPQGDEYGRVDERWYWAAIAMLERDAGLIEWMQAASGWPEAIPEQEGGEHFRAHRDQMIQAMRGGLDLGRRPSDLAEVLARFALGGPGVCALRALRRVATDVDWNDPALLLGAARVANGFRTLFNLPESVVLIQNRDEQPYWRQALDYAVEGNLQAVLDEQVHVLPEQLGRVEAPAAERIDAVARAVTESLSMRSAQLKVDDVRVNKRRLEVADLSMRCRFALRFGDMRDDTGGALARADSVRAAFNSPFRPFVLASTSVGQEGLDFHTWCHSVVHWNLPSNPVDMEQREGRVHRYKGHAVRRNVAQHIGLAALADWQGEGDPWARLFECAEATEFGQQSDLAPWWIYEAGDARIMRRVLLLPLSRDVGRLKRMKRQLALYRMVFGQPRQEDLIAYLDHALPEDAPEDWQISLLPPALPG
ncbi:MULTISPECIES: helicase-related protein [unclassified Thioalkalivibrio]|uniref:DEAD/DEAH box helicase n=1 Tax=unclassified Thioalkalivibrio TaxID=2621013 RepID=UPI00035D13D2|nr:MULTISPECIES: helicase-related protein [unclassified Thioalkalivibrio]